MQWKSSRIQILENMQPHCLPPLYRHRCFISISRTIALFSTTSFRDLYIITLQHLPGFLLSINSPSKTTAWLSYLCCSLSSSKSSNILHISVCFAHLEEVRKIHSSLSSHFLILSLVLLWRQNTEMSSSISSPNPCIIIKYLLPHSS